MAPSHLTLSIAAAASAALLSAVLTWAIRPLMMRIALARPNARSSHRVPTPQGAGVAVIAATLIASGAALAWLGTGDLQFQAPAFFATMFIAAVGLIDDIRPIPVVLRLA